MSQDTDYPRTPPKGEGTFPVDLGTKLKRKLEDESTRRSRRAGRKIWQADIVRRALAIELGLMAPDSPDEK